MSPFHPGQVKLGWGREMYSAILSTPGAPVALHCPVRLSAFFRCLWRTFSPGRSASSHLQQGRCVGYSVHIELHTAVQLPDPLVAPLSHVCQTEGFRPLWAGPAAVEAVICGHHRPAGISLLRSTFNSQQVSIRTELLCVSLPVTTCSYFPTCSGEQQAI